MRNLMLLGLKALIFSVLPCLSSCQTAPQIGEAPKPPAKVSSTQERYKKTVEDRLGMIWYRLVDINEDSLDLGTVETTFEIPAAGGSVRNLKITSNTGGPTDELVARSAILQLRTPPVPPEILDELQQDYMFFEESFTVFDKKKQPSPTLSKKR